MRLPWQRTPTTEPVGTAREARRIEARIGYAERRAVEAVLSQAASDFAEEDAGWRKMGMGADSFDLEQTALVALRRRCVALWQIDPLAGQVANLLNSGTFGKGLGAPHAADTRVQDCVNRLWDDEDNQLAVFSRGAQWRMNTLLLTGGEDWITVHTSQVDGAVKLATLPADEFTAVITHPDNAYKPVLYKREYREQVYSFKDGRYIPAETVTVAYYRDLRYHPDNEGALDDEAAQELIKQAGSQLADPCVIQVAVNTIGLRGIPEFYRMYDWCRAHARAVEDLTTFAKALAMIAWVKKVKTSNQTAIANAAKQFQQPGVGVAGVQVENDRVDLTPVDVGTGGTANLQQAARATKLEALTPSGFGEHWTGDASTGNLATATAMELPAIWRIEDRQTLWADVYRRIIAFAIDRAMAQHEYRLPEEVDRSVDVDFPDAQAPNPLPRAQAIVTLAPLITKREASWQAYQTLGSNNADELLNEQYPPQEKLEGQKGKDEGGTSLTGGQPSPDGAAAQPGVTQTPVGAPATEAVRAAEAAGFPHHTTGALAAARERLQR